MEKHTPRNQQTPHVKRRCHRCHGTGQAPCQICSGSGRVATGKDVYGNQQFDRCNGCLGSRSRRCSACSGEGFV